MKNIIKDWILIADNDMKIIERLMGDEAVIASGVIFHCQQAIEKYFKAYLIEHGWNLQKTHDLVNLYAEIKPVKDLELDENMLDEIFNMYIDARYPDDYKEPSKEEAENAWKFTQEIESKIKHELGITAEG
ncbi:MAG: HEPN domain-containing protein [Endomicrobia bacterium]|nr:HEPN domain-containing protein [Endomicrobiia bacterium]